MDSAGLRALQAPLKARYREHPEEAMVTLRARASLDDSAIACKVETGRALVEAGLHPATGGDGLAACSGDMLLEALAACAGVTLRAVATALEIPIRSGTVEVEGDLDFRGTLGVAKDQPVGFKEIRLRFDLDTQAPTDQVARLLSLTERYCVVYQTLSRPPALKFS
jgi:uncharacterized OsmC-like protein